MIKQYSDYYRPTGTPQSVIDEWVTEHGISEVTSGFKVTGERK